MSKLSRGFLPKNYRENTVTSFFKLVFCLNKVLRYFEDLVVHEDAAAMFAGHNFLAHANFELELRWHLVEATAASIPLNSHDGLAVAVRVADF